MNLQSINAAASPEVQVNENFETIDYSSVYGKRQPVTTGLTWGYYGGRWGGFTVAAGTFTLTNAADNYVVAKRSDGVTSASTSATNWNDTAANARVYKLTTAGGVVTAVEDHRAGLYGVHGAAASVLMGGSTTAAPAVTTANVNTTAVGNAGVGEDNLISYALPASSLSAAGKGVHIVAWGITANNGDAKTVKLYFGSVAILTNALTVSVAGKWRIEADVFSTGTDAQDYCAQLVTTGAADVALNDVEIGTATQDDGAAITIKCTGEGTSNNDIVQEGMVITFHN